MKKIAVDIVLLPSSDMMDKAIEFNKELTETSDNEIKLNKIGCLPHITLAMGCVKKEDIRIIDEMLKGLAKRFGKFRLKTISSEEEKAWFRIKNNKKLQSLHEAIMNGIRPYFTYGINKKMLYKSENEEIGGPTINYIKQFPSRSSFKNYIPHITVSSCDARVKVPEIKFTSSILAMCRLGNHCTCRRIVLSQGLG